MQENSTLKPTYLTHIMLSRQEKGTGLKIYLNIASQHTYKENVHMSLQKQPVLQNQRQTVGHQKVSAGSLHNRALKNHPSD